MLVLSVGWTAAGAGGAATAGFSAGALPLPPGRLRRLLRRGAGLEAAPAAGGAATALASGGLCLVATPVTCRLTVAPTSPSAHIAPSAVWRSTRHTTIEEEAPAAGGRFCVRVQRA